MAAAIANILGMCSMQFDQFFFPLLIHQRAVGLLCATKQQSAYLKGQHVHEGSQCVFWQLCLKPLSPLPSKRRAWLVLTTTTTATRKTIRQRHRANASSTAYGKGGAQCTLDGGQVLVAIGRARGKCRKLKASLDPLV